jgi:raffinose/stachyose/melibiose transport system substrate-binding protein
MTGMPGLTKDWRRLKVQRRLSLPAVLVALALTLGLAACGGGSSGGATAGAGKDQSGLGSSYDVSKAGKVTLTMWWLGDQEVPGIQGWMKQIVQKYEQLHPNVTIKQVVQSTDTWTQTQEIACKGKSGPDLWYSWAGTWSLEPGWQGCTVPNEAVLSSEDLSHTPNTAESRWQGKTWSYPLYRFVYPIIVNRTLFKRAGLDPDNPPQTWDEFISACDKLKSKGIQPIVLGLKDGFGGEIAGSATFQKQLFGDYKNLIKMVVDGNFTDPAWKSWITKAAQLKPYVNDDVNSLSFGDALTHFRASKAAMAFGTPGVQATIASMTKAGNDVGVMEPPAFGPSPHAKSLAQTGNGFQVTGWSSHAKAAGNFIAFMHKPENLASLYAKTGNFPADDRWTGSDVRSPTDKTMLGWLREATVFYPANYYPTDLDVNGNFVVFQGLLGGKMTVDEAAQTYQSVIEKWRKLHPGEIDNYRAWAAAG